VQEFKSLDEVIDFAISMERASHEFYVALAGMTEKPDVAELFRTLAQEELLHAERLRTMKAQPHTESIASVDMKSVAGYAAAVSVESMSYLDAVKMALDKEEGSTLLYQRLAAELEAPELKKLFTALAWIEDQHRTLMRRQYESLRIAEN